MRYGRYRHRAPGTLLVCGTTAVARRRSRRHQHSRLRGPGARPGESAGGTLPAGLATPAITLRPATPADAEFCCRLHKAATGGYITAAWGWDEQVQRAFHDRAFTPHRWQVITAGQASTGMPDTGCRPGRDLLVTHRDRPRPSAPRHRQPDRRGAPGGSRAHRPGPGSRRADGQPPRPSALPAAWPYRSRRPRRTGHQGHHAVRAAPQVATGAIAAKVGDLPLRHYLCTEWNTHSRAPGLAGDRRRAFSIVRAGNQIDALMFVKGLGGTFRGCSSGGAG